MLVVFSVTVSKTGTVVSDVMDRITDGYNSFDPSCSEKRRNKAIELISFFEQTSNLKDFAVSTANDRIILVKGVLYNYIEDKSFVDNVI